MPGDAPYSRVSRDSITDEQLARLIRIIDQAERYASNHDGLAAALSAEVAKHYRQDALALRELHALLVHERQERVIDRYEAGEES